MSTPSTIARVDADTARSEQLLQIREALLPLQGVSGLLVFVRGEQGDVTVITGEANNVPHRELPWESASPETVEIALEGGSQLFIEDETTGHVYLRPAQAMVTATMRLLEVKNTEDRLLEELSASWESLEALYEISTDCLRSVNIIETLTRLIDRLVSMSVGLHATLFVRQEDFFEPLVSTDACSARVAGTQLGWMTKMSSERQTITMTHVPGEGPLDVCWREAVVIAAAPLTLRQEMTGFLVVWHESPGFKFDSAFLRLLEAIAYQASIMLERDRLNQQVRESELLAKEIEIASSIQQTLLLANSPQVVPGLELAACSLPSQYIDGDFYDFFQHAGNLDVVVGDVMGKGVAAALLGAATKNQLLRSIANLALRSTSGAPSPVDIVRRAASRISQQLIALERFVTMCYARFDTQAKVLYLVDCGHTPTILSRKAEPCLFLRSEDLPLGVLQPYECSQQSLSYRLGDTFLFYSDGVTENRSPDGEFFGPERLAECVQHWSCLGPALLVEQIRKVALQFKGVDRFADDFTCIAVRISLDSERKQPLFSTTANFPAEREELTRFRAWLYQVIFPLTDGFDEAGRARMELCCCELFVNFAIHRDPILHPGPIRVECDCFPDHVVMRMMHQGPDFDPLAIPAPAFDGSKDEGFGTFLILHSADEATYERDPQGFTMITVSFLRTEASPYAITN